MGDPEVLQDDIVAKVLAIHETLKNSDVPHAFGGAIALGFHGLARGTSDIDLNLFIRPDERQRALDAFEQLFPIENRPDVEARVSRDAQGVVRWGNTKIDIFFSSMEFHDSMLERAIQVEFYGSPIPVLSGEDLIVCKVAFDRAKDWLDIENMCTVMGKRLNVKYLMHWIDDFFPADDPRPLHLAEVMKNARA
ncbi:MAG: nucleotidyl transferase AbiEii/AbiGii toxin family protein [Thermoleophilaceae bacterium]|nr:nucleotidyl transferase AbiEii/AbiGii toxin family protein [Thermoleophilaceae bacterium]